MSLTNLLVEAGDYCTGLGGNANFSIPAGVGNMINLVIILIQIAVPILLIILGMIDFAKATVGGDEDKIKAGQKTFMKRFIAALIVFLIVTIVQLVVTAVGSVSGSGDGNKATTAWDCAAQIIKKQPGAAKN